MKNTSSKSSGQKSLNPTLIAVLALLSVVVIGAVLFVRLDGPHAIRRMQYGHVTRAAYHKEYQNLRPALEGLGLSETADAASSCVDEEIATDGITPENRLFCGLETDNYVVITAANKQQVLSAAKQLDELVAQGGGELQTNIETTFGKYIADIANGVDYYPDFGATFVRDDYLCGVHFNVAYSKPKPPAYSIQFGCNAPRVMADDFYLPPPSSEDSDV